MTQLPAERLYALLPGIHRQRDLEAGEPLRALLAVIEQELQALEADANGLYENWFIETCEEWLVPYIGALLGVRGLGDEKDVVLSQRARVANTIRYRRRKGTLPALEALIRDVTGWTARAVELRDLVAGTQHLGHVRPGWGGSVDLRGVGQPPPVGGAFDTAAHTVDVRSVGASVARHHPLHLGLFLWRLQSYGVVGSPALSVPPDGSGRYTFHPLGLDIPLFTRPRRAGDMTRSLVEPDVPGPILPGALARDLVQHAGDRASPPEAGQPLATAYCGAGRSFAIRVAVPAADGRFRALRPSEIVVRDLGDWGRDGWPRPSAGTVAIDPRRGRIAFGVDSAPEGTLVEVDYHCGFSADIGGGPYDRRAGLVDLRANVKRVNVAKRGGADVETLGNAWKARPEDERPLRVIRFTDSGVYGGPNIVIPLADNERLAIEAADGVRPCLRLVAPLRVVGPTRGIATLVLDGLLIEGRIELEGNVALHLAHCTVLPKTVPERGSPAVFETGPAISVSGAPDRLSVSIAHSIVGALRLPDQGAQLAVRDSIVGLASTTGGAAHPAIAGTEVSALPFDTAAGPRLGPTASIERTTVFGPVCVRELTLASETLFTAGVHVERQQLGCVRYSHVPQGSRAPPCFRCQPMLALDGVPADEHAVVRARVRPRFVSTHYGHPGYAQLAANCAAEVRNGAEGGGEMGVFRSLEQAQRRINLGTVLDEYLPVRLEAGTFFVT